ATSTRTTKMRRSPTCRVCRARSKGGSTTIRKSAASRKRSSGGSTAGRRSRGNGAQNRHPNIRRQITLLVRHDGRTVANPAAGRWRDARSEERRARHDGRGDGGDERAAADGSGSRGQSEARAGDDHGLPRARGRGLQAEGHRRRRGAEVPQLEERVSEEGV